MNAEPTPDGPEAIRPAGVPPSAGALARAVELFNDGSYHDAHEVLEELWLATQGTDSDFFKGLIQACIALHHLREDNPDGARKLYSGHRRLLAAYLPRHRGLDVEALLAEMQRVLSPVVRARPGAQGRFDPDNRPRMELLGEDPQPDDAS